MDPHLAIDRLTQCRTPWLIGVRHHSPAIATVLPGLLEVIEPEVVAVELPAEAAQWLGWLTDPKASAPLALAFNHNEHLSFYPFADFSPELVALRWAWTNNVPVRCIDLPLAAHEADDGHLDEPTKQQDQSETGWAEALAARARAGVGDLNETWDRLVEARAPGSSPEQIRVAALAHGWASRQSSSTIDSHTLARESWMRNCLAPEIAAGRRVVALVGAFHAPALVDLDPDPVSRCLPTMDQDVSGCVVGYSFAQMDSRSGYPAGIRDPGWQQAVLESGLNPDRLVEYATSCITDITRELREQGHPAGPGEASETLRFALDLARIRGLLAPGRRELIEAVTSVLAQGEVLGRGRSVAGSLEKVLIGDRRGRIAPGTPVPALRNNLIDSLTSLKLPTAGARQLNLAPLRGGRDAKVHVLLNQLLISGIAYGSPDEARTWRGSATVTTRWDLEWNSATEASISLAGVRGLTAEQVATTTLLTRKVTTQDDVAQLLVDAAECASVSAVQRAFALVGELVPRVGFSAAVRLAVVLSDISLSRVPGAALLPVGLRLEAERLGAELHGAAVRELRGVYGSDSNDDALALAVFVKEATDRELGVQHALAEIVENGSPLMQGAALGLRLDQENSGRLLASWLDAMTLESRRVLSRRVAGLLITSAARFDTAEPALSLVERVNTLEASHFVTVLPALRGGFDVLSDQHRTQLLMDLAGIFGRAAELVLPPEETMAATRHDAEARQRLAALGLADLAFSPAERWRLILGSPPEDLSGDGRRLASALDELYGRPGSDALDHKLRSAGHGPSQLGVREWGDEIESLFGAEGIQEIFGQAALSGRADVLERLDPDQIRPSVELLTTALSLVGALSEARLARLRPLVSRLVKDLTDSLATRIRPALTGLAGSKPTRRRVGELDLNRTIRANLRNAVLLDDRVQVVPAHPVFTQPNAKEADWHIVIVVDVSGSMSESVIFSALTAAVLAGVNCLEVTFLAFSTEVIDFSGQVSDPLALLLEVDVGGGTNIAGALRVARSRVKVPNRTLCVLISDFEEFGSPAPLLAEIEALNGSGVHLLGCAALNDSGKAVYNVGIAHQAAEAGMRVAALSPLELAHWVGSVIRS